MPQKIQLAIQGGGAKICDLLAAAEVVEKLSADAEIEVSRLAGTSAGAIIASMLAAAKPAATLKETLIREGTGYLASIVPAHVANVIRPATRRLRRVTRPYHILRILFRVFSGHPLFEEEQLRTFLEEVFGALTMKQLRIETFLVAADIGNGGPKVYSKSLTPETKVVDALLDSCGLPYFFRAPRNLGAGAYVDGGVCENLPSDLLFGEQSKRKEVLEKFGPVIGISFHEENEDRIAPGAGVLEFSMALVNTFISNSVLRAKNSIGVEAVFPIKTHIGTFDFHEALTDGLKSDHYGRVQADARDWFEILTKTLKEQQQKRVSARRNTASMKPHWW